MSCGRRPSTGRPRSGRSTRRARRKRRPRQRKGSRTGVGQAVVARERPVAARVRAEVGRLERNDVGHRLREGEAHPAVGRAHDPYAVLGGLLVHDLAVRHVDRAVRPHTDVGELLLAVALSQPHRRRERLAAVGRAREVDDVVRGLAGVARPGDVHVPGGRRARALVRDDIDLVLEQSPDRRRAAVHPHGSDVRGAVVVIASDVERAVRRLGAVEADEAVVEVPASVEGLRRVAGGRARAVSRRRGAERRCVGRVARHEAERPAHAAVRGAVVPRPDVAGALLRSPRSSRSSPRS